jgi:hypothetical protein
MMSTGYKIQIDKKDRDQWPNLLNIVTVINKRACMGDITVLLLEDYHVMLCFDLCHACLKLV